MLSDTQVQRLQDIAYAACHTGHVWDARLIFTGLLALRPKASACKIGMALSHTVVGEFDEAEKLLLTNVLAANPEDGEALAMLGMNYVLAGRLDDAQKILAALERTQGPGSPLAKELLAALG